jgi:hypothetical protein
MDRWNGHDCVIPNPGDSRQYPACTMQRGMQIYPPLRPFFVNFFVYELENETEFSTFHIDQGMGNSTGCRHFNQPAVTELAL